MTSDNDETHGTFGTILNKIRGRRRPKESPETASPSTSGETLEQDEESDLSAILQKINQKPVQPGVFGHEETTIGSPAAETPETSGENDLSVLLQKIGQTPIKPGSSIPPEDTAFLSSPPPEKMVIFDDMLEERSLTAQQSAPPGNADEESSGNAAEVITDLNLPPSQPASAPPITTDDIADDRAGSYQRTDSGTDVFPATPSGTAEGDISDLLKKIRDTHTQKENGEGRVSSPDKSAETPKPGAVGAQDLSALIQKIGMTSSAPALENTPPAPHREPDPAPLGEADEFDDLPGDIPAPVPSATSPEVNGDDVREVLGKLMARSGAAAAVPAVPVSSPPDGGHQEQATSAVAESRSEPSVEIVDEDPREIRKPSIFKKKKQKETTPSAKPEDTEGPETDDRIISADQLSSYSGLILPKGATFKIDEIRLHGSVNPFENTGTGTLPPELADIWKREFSTAGFKDLDLEADFSLDKEHLKPAAPKKTRLGSLFNVIRTPTIEYDPKEHGPLVDLSYDVLPGIEVMELYPVNEPYAYVRVIYDHSTHEYTYQVIEPVLSEPEKDLLKEIKERLFETLDINTKDISKEEARRQLRSAVDDILSDYGITLKPVQREKLLYNMHKDFLGDGLIDAIMHDKYIEDISCDGVNTPIFAFHSSYESMKTTLMYHNAEELDSFVTKLAQRAGKYISISEPIVDATMGDGSRIQMTLGQEVTAHGSTFTIRKFKDEPITPTDLIEWHTFAPLSVAYIWLAVENGKSAIFAGGTASGKTTSLNAISLFIPPMAKIVSLEDTRELKLPHPNWIPSVTRDSFDTAGKGEINMYELLRAAMRQRPEYILVGEVRGKECQTLFQAMSTGHVTYSTIHADSVASVVHRIENPPMDVPRNMLSALDIVCIQVQARMGGKRIRRNKQIVEILDIDPRTNELITNEVFRWRSATDEITYSGKSYILEEIMEARGWNENRMREELKRRQEVLEWMRIKKIRHYKEVAKILISYFREPEVVIERVRKDLYE